MAMSDEERRRRNRERKRKWRQENPEKEREHQRKWCQENPEKVREYKRKWRQENPEKEREHQRRYRQKNPEKVRERQRRYRQKNAERVRECIRRCRQENPETVRAYSRRRRARKRNATVRGHKPTARKIEQLRMRFGWCCAACSKPLDNGTGHIDHFIPLDRGGKDAMWNLVPMCAKCNCAKSNSDPLEWLKRKRLVRKFARNLQQSGHWIAHPHFRHINENVGSPKEEREDGRSEASTQEQ